MSLENKRVVLAFSGGLDTSCILKWLLERGYEVVCFVADVGQQLDNLDEVREKALKIGASKIHVVDVRKEFVTDFVFPTIRANAIYEGQYLLGTAIARPVIAKAQVHVAKLENCKFLSHGATGKGNDQVRFELTANALDPELEIIAPWREPEFFERFQGRVDLMKYAEEKGIPVDQTPKKPYSIDENLFHISYESGVLEDPEVEPPEEMFRMTTDPMNAPDKKEKIRIHFKQGNPVKIENLDTGIVETDPLELFLYLNDLGKKHGIGRIDIVENRFVGIKSRGVYETPGGTILRKAHLDLEGIVLDREVRKLRDSLSSKFAELTYNGFWYSPEMDVIMSAIDKSQEFVDGHVDMYLYKGNIIVAGRGSPVSLYNKDQASMDVAGGYNPQDAEGFIRINGLRLKTHSLMRKLISETDAERFAEVQKSSVFGFDS